MSPINERAHHLCVRKLIADEKKNGGWVPRKDLEELLRNSRYASTAESKISGYMNDIRRYNGGILETKTANGSRLIKHYRLVNVGDFNPRTGINFKLHQDPSRFAVGSVQERVTPLRRS